MKRSDLRPWSNRHAAWRGPDRSISTIPVPAGIPANTTLRPERRTEIRQALGVLDAVFLGEPGVLEARQRIVARMRSAGKKGAGTT